MNAPPGDVMGPMAVGVGTDAAPGAASTRIRQAIVDPRMARRAMCMPGRYHPRVPAVDGFRSLRLEAHVVRMVDVADDDVALHPVLVAHRVVDARGHLRLDDPAHALERLDADADADDRLRRVSIEAA